MKQVAILSTMLLFALVSLQVSAQEEVKKDIKQTKKEIKATKKELKGDKNEPKTELRSERKELRELRGKIVSDQSKAQFYTDFGNIPNVKWERTKYFDEATFEKDGKMMKAYYDIQSMLVGTTCDKTFADLPAKSQKKINTKYKDYTIGSVLYFDENEDYDPDYMILFETPFEHLDHYFVELTKGNKKIILIVTKEGDVSWFKDL
jgi:Predicted membrane protein